MTSETILVVDAGQDIEQRMTTALEAENYLVYTVTSHDVNVEMAELLKPSLIYIKPLDLSPTGLEPCKTVHSIPLLKKVPIIILTSPESPLGSNYSKDYGIMGSLELTFEQDELIEKTETSLGKTAPSKPIKEDKPVSPSTHPVKSSERKRSGFIRPAAGVAILLVIAGAGFLAYERFMPTLKVPALKVPALRVPPTPAVKAPQQTPSKATSPVPPKAPESGSESSLPTKKDVASAPAPASSVPSTSPAKPALVLSESAPQPPRKPFYSVQLGAFKNEGYAQDLTKEFREKGYDAFIQPGVMKDKSPIYRVLVNKVEDRKTAKKLAEEIESKEEIETSLYSE